MDRGGRTKATMDQKKIARECSTMPASPIRHVSTPTKLSQTRHSLDRAIHRASRVCASDPKARECRVAWDEVDELSRVVHRLRCVEVVQDTLCVENPSDTECRIYDL